MHFFLGKMCKKVMKFKSLFAAEELVGKMLMDAGVFVEVCVYIKYV